MASITQNMRYRLSLIHFAQKYGVTRAAVRYKTNRQYIYRWLRRFDGSIESLRDRSRRPHHHPNQHAATGLANTQSGTEGLFTVGVTYV